MKKLIIALFSVFILWQQSYALNLSEIRTEVRRIVRDQGSDRYSDAVLNSLVNQGQKDINNQTWKLYKTTAYVLSPLTTYYNLPGDFLAMRQAYFKNSQGDNLVIDALAERSLIQKNGAWEKERGTPVSYYVSAATNPTVTSSSTMRISYIPIPTVTSTGTVTLLYYNEPPDLAMDSDLPFEGRRNLFSYHMALVYYTVMRIRLIEGVPDEATVYQNLYAGQVAIMEKRAFMTPDLTPGFSAGGTGR